MSLSGVPGIFNWTLRIIGSVVVSTPSACPASRRYWRCWPESRASAEALHQMLPSGELQDLAFERQESDGRWLLSGRLHDLTWHRWQMVRACAN